MATIYTFVVSFRLPKSRSIAFILFFCSSKKINERKFLSVIPMGPSLFKSLKRRHLEMSLGKNEG